MDVELLYFDQCPHWQLAGERLQAALAAVGRADQPISYVQVDTAEGAAVSGFAGSPTILANGRDPFRAPGATLGGLSCRLFSTPDGLAGSPTVEQLSSVLR
ncbi:hypothetical protein [Cellulomonas sp. Root137]|uniref:hypothetical protein n=1 Tax=Cellulomonas sp. Root137 TaxID=1736459 RepID=UPI00070231C7|nr:hypothetical protein [Cellulomonas sp. Root137]KQY47946.1 alkylmercury lyase [Cellulomonas sp. Root137]